MTNNETAFYNSLQGLKVFFGAHATEIATVPALEDAVDEFNTVLTELDEAISLQDTDTTGTTASKETSREGTSRLTVLLSQSLCAYAVSIDDKELEKNAHVTKSQLHDKSEGLFKSRVDDIVDLGTTHLAALAPFGYTSAKLTALGSAFTTWKGKVGKVAHVTAHGETGTATIKRLIPQLQNLLDNTIDRLVAVVAADTPAFGDEYAAVREINDAPTQTRALDVTITDSASHAPLPNVRAIIMPGEIIKVTGPSGSFYINNFAPGDYTMTFSKNNYADGNHAFSIADGETTELNLVMVAG